MQAKRVSIIVKGKVSKVLVSPGGGPKKRTTGGLNKAALMKNKSGKVVSKKDATAGKRACKLAQAWTQAVKTARKLNKVATSLKKTSSPKLLRAG